MIFIQCKECDTIIAIKDLKEPFTPDIFDRATPENTIHGEDLCAACAARHEEEERKRREEEESQQDEETSTDESIEESE